MSFFPNGLIKFYYENSADYLFDTSEIRPLEDIDIDIEECRFTCRLCGEILYNLSDSYIHLVNSSYNTICLIRIPGSNSFHPIVDLIDLSVEQLLHLYIQVHPASEDFQ